MEAELARVLRYYPSGELQNARRVEQGFVNENWVVNTTRGRFFLKRRHPSLRQRDLIVAQHELMRRLRRSGFPAPTIIATIRGDTFLVLDQEWYEMQGYIEGEPYDHHRREHLEEAALTLGKYHKLIDGFAPEALCHVNELYTPATARTLLARLTQTWHLAQDPTGAEISQQVKSHIADLTARLADHRILPRLVIHGDYYADNLIFEDDRIVGVVDYDKACWQPRVVELAEALVYFASPRPGYMKHIVYPGVLNWDPFMCFVQSYAETAALGAGEMDALPHYVRSIWISAALRRLVESDGRRHHTCEALLEVLELAEWATDNAEQMIDIARAATSR